MSHDVILRCLLRPSCFAKRKHHPLDSGGKKKGGGKEEGGEKKKKKKEKQTAKGILRTTQLLRRWAAKIWAKLAC